MSYVLSTSRNLQIASRITDVDKKDNNNEIDALVQLLKINTAQPNASFLNEFRALKDNNTFVNDLCQRKGVFGSIVYAFRRDNYRAERYKTIMNQLKIGGYNDQYNKKISYFSTASNLQKSLCEKLEEIKNTYLAKTYVSKEDSSSAKVIFDQLQTFNENVGFKTPTYDLMSINIQCEADNDTGIWYAFVKIYPEYLCLSQENQNGEEFNINGYSTKSLKQKILATLELDKDTNLFTDDNKLTESVGNKIKEQLRKLIQQKAAIKIQDKVRGFQARLRNKPQDDFGNIIMTYSNPISKRSEKRQKFAFSKNYIGYDITDDNPKDKIENGPYGAFKQVIVKNKNSVIFKDRLEETLKNLTPSEIKRIRERMKPRFTSSEIERILIKNKITSYTGTLKLPKGYSVARNAGERDLYDALKANMKFTVEDFIPLLKDTKELHSKNFYHLDIKRENIMVKYVNANKKLTMVDLDSFSSFNNRASVFGTAHRKSECLVQEYINAPTAKKLQTFDEFAFALTILESCGIYIDATRYNMLGYLASLLPKINKFVTDNIKEQHQENFIKLVKYPGLYSTMNNSNVYLADMFKCCS